MWDMGDMIGVLVFMQTTKRVLDLGIHLILNHTFAGIF